MFVMTWVEFTIRLMLAQVLGAGIGVERQWRQRMAGLRTNALVATGAALFVMLGSMIPGESSPTRVVSYVVSGIGFLGGGVILREGFTVRGLNTAATLWCAAAAVGCLAGWGFLPEASIGAYEPPQALERRRNHGWGIDTELGTRLARSTPKGSSSRRDQ